MSRSPPSTAQLKDTADPARRLPEGQGAGARDPQGQCRQGRGAAPQGRRPPPRRTRGAGQEPHQDAQPPQRRPRDPQAAPRSARHLRGRQGSRWQGHPLPARRSLRLHQPRRQGPRHARHDLLGLHAGEGIPTTGEGKATIEITSVYDDVAAGKIISRSRNQPVLEGDLVANAIYSKTRKHKFLVVGRFDLDNTGIRHRRQSRPHQGHGQEWGGEVVETVDTGTDFVVLGQGPAQPVAPPATASPIDKQRYQEALKAFEEFQGSRDRGQVADGADPQPDAVPALRRLQPRRHAGLADPAPPHPGSRSSRGPEAIGCNEMPNGCEKHLTLAAVVLFEASP